MTQPDTPTPGSPLSADDVGLLTRGELIEFCKVRYGTLGTYKAGQQVVFLASNEDGFSIDIDGPYGEDSWPFNYLRLPTDRRAEAEAVDWSDALQAAWDENNPDTPPSAGPDAGLVERLKSHMGKADIQEVLSDCRSAAAALEAAAKREATEKALSVQNYNRAIARAARAEAQVAALREALEKIKARTTRHPDDTIEDEAKDARKAHIIASNALSAIPTPGRE